MGEAKRRKATGTYPDQHAGDAVPDYAGFNSKLRRLFPKIAERDIGLAWMRAEGAGVDVPEGGPENWPEMPGTLIVHLIHDTASLNSAIKVVDIDQAIAAWKASSLSRQETRAAILGEIATNRHMIREVGGSLIVAAIGLAFTSDAGPLLRPLAEAGNLRLTYDITDYIEQGSGKRAINFRLSAGDQRDPPLRLSLAEMPPQARPDGLPPTGTTH